MCESTNRFARTRISSSYDDIALTAMPMQKDHKLSVTGGNNNNNNNKAYKACPFILDTTNTKYLSVMLLLITVFHCIDAF